MSRSGCDQLVLHTHHVSSGSCDGVSWSRRPCAAVVTRLGVATATGLYGNRWIWLRRTTGVWQLSRLPITRCVHVNALAAAANLACGLP